MSLAVTLEDPNSPTRSISPFQEFGAYEALWTEQKASFRWIAEKFRGHPGAIPSDFIPIQVAVEHAHRAQKLLLDSGVERFAIRVHGSGEYPEKLRNAEHPVELLYFQG